MLVHDKLIEAFIRDGKAGKVPMIGSTVKIEIAWKIVDGHTMESKNFNQIIMTRVRSIEANFPGELYVHVDHATIRGYPLNRLVWDKTWMVEYDGFPGIPAKFPLARIGCSVTFEEY